MLTLRPTWKWFVLALGLGAFVPVACDGTGRTELVLPPGILQDGGTLPDVGSFDAPVQDDAGDWDAAADAGLSPVIVGITPNPRGDGPPAIGDVIDARLAALAAGSRGMVVRRAPAELVSEDAWKTLEAEASAYGKNGVTISFVFAVVDGMVSGIDSSLTGLSWDDPNMINAMHERMDQVFVRLAGAAPIFIIGRDIDVFLASRPEERSAFEVLLLDLLVYARTNPMAPPNMRVGVGFSFAGVKSSDPSFSLLLEGSDLAVVSYLPGLGSDMVGLASDVATDADVLVERAAGKPIVLEALGYPTAEAVGGSEAKQALFLETFFTVLGPRRSNFAFVNVDTLHDLGPGRCAERAMLAGHSADSAWATFMCSLGLFAADGQAKPSWQVFLGGAAAFASP